ncbi:DNA alkylation repair protein [candidate division WOR-3 bacterium]|nr:DNA alkylation repair protein [candidate division WOR-3 bacterium]
MDYLKPLVKSYKQHINAEKASGMKKYMRDQFDFIGISSPMRKELFKSFINEYGYPENDSLISVIKALWELNYRDYQYSAIGMIITRIKTLDTDFIPITEYMITNKSWWDTVDAISSNIAGPLLLKDKKFMRSINKKWINSDNMWLRRTALIFQLNYKDRMDEKILYTNIRKCAKEKEFFIRKAIGWALRQHARKNPESVRDFVNNTELSTLSTREALKRIGK